MPARNKQHNKIHSKNIEKALKILREKNTRLKLEISLLELQIQVLNQLIEQAEKTNVANT